MFLSMFSNKFKLCTISGILCLLFTVKAMAIEENSPRTERAWNIAIETCNNRDGVKYFFVRQGYFEFGCRDHSTFELPL